MAHCYKGIRCPHRLFPCHNDIFLCLVLFFFFFFFILHQSSAPRSAGPPEKLIPKILPDAVSLYHKHTLHFDTHICIHPGNWGFGDLPSQQKPNYFNIFKTIQHITITVSFDRLQTCPSGYFLGHSSRSDWDRTTNLVVVDLGQLNGSLVLPSLPTTTSTSQREEKKMVEVLSRGTKEREREREKERDRPSPSGWML